MPSIQITPKEAEAFVSTYSAIQEYIGKLEYIGNFCEDILKEAGAADLRERYEDADYESFMDKVRNVASS